MNSLLDKLNLKDVNPGASTRGPTVIVLIGLCAAMLISPPPVAACTSETVAHYLDSARVDLSALPEGVSIGVGQDLVPWTKDIPLDSFQLEGLDHQYDRPFGEDYLAYASSAIFGVRNLTSSTITIVRSIGPNQTPVPSSAVLPAGKSLAFEVRPHTAASFYFDETEGIVETFHEVYLSDSSAPVELNARLSVYVDGKMYEIDFTVVREVNPRYVEINKAMEECQRLEMQGYQPNLFQQIGNLLGLRGMGLSPDATLIIAGVFVLIGSLAVIGVVLILRHGRDS